MLSICEVLWIFLLNIFPRIIFISCGFFFSWYQTNIINQTSLKSQGAVLDNFRLPCTELLSILKHGWTFCQEYIERFVVTFFFKLWMKMHNSAKVRHYKNFLIKDCKTGAPVRIMIEDVTSISLKNIWK